MQQRKTSLRALNVNLCCVLISNGSGSECRVRVLEAGGGLYRTVEHRRLIFDQAWLLLKLFKRQTLSNHYCCAIRFDLAVPRRAAFQSSFAAKLQWMLPLLQHSAKTHGHPDLTCMP